MFIHSNSNNNLEEKSLEKYIKELETNKLLIKDLENSIEKKDMELKNYKKDFKNIKNNYDKFKSLKVELYEGLSIMKNSLITYEKEIERLHCVNKSKDRQIKNLKDNIKSQDKRFLSLIQEINTLQNKICILNNKLNNKSK